jgi:hypothetical protein
MRKSRVRNYTIRNLTCVRQVDIIRVLISVRTRWAEHLGGMLKKLSRYMPGQAIGVPGG